MSPITYLTTQYRKLAVWFVRKRDNRIWTERKAAAMAQLPEAHHLWMEGLVDNEISHIRMCASQRGGYITHQSRQEQDYIEQLLLDTTVQTLIELIPLTEIVGMQPLKGPVGLVTRLAFKRDDTSGSLRLSFINSAVEAGSRKLQIRINHTSIADRGLEEEFTRAMGSEIAREIIVEVLHDLAKLATHAETFDGKSYKEPWVVTSGAMIAVNKVANEIARTTMRGAGNFMIVSPGLLCRMQMDPMTKITPPETPSTSLILPYCGLLNGCIRIYMSTDWADRTVDDLDTEQVLVGYKGMSGAADAGYYYCPYVMLMTTGVVMDANTFMPCVMLMTRYGKLAVSQDQEPISASSHYYGIVTLKNLYGADPFAVDLPSEVVEDAPVVSDNNA